MLPAVIEISIQFQVDGLGNKKGMQAPIYKTVLTTVIYQKEDTGTTCGIHYFLWINWIIEF